MTDKVIEAVARVLCTEWDYSWDGNPDEDDQVVPEVTLGYDQRPSKTLFREAARAAITAYEAAREPLDLQLVSDLLIQKVKDHAASVPQQEPVAFLVRDYADGWVGFSPQNEKQARDLAERMDTLFLPVYAPAPGNNS